MFILFIAYTAVLKILYCCGHWFTLLSMTCNVLLASFPLRLCRLKGFLYITRYEITTY